MGILFTNDASSALQTSITTSATQITIATADAGLFPAPGVGDHFMATVVDTSGNMEIMKCTARASGVMTVARAQEGTSAFAFAAGAVVALRLTKGTVEEFLQKSGGTMTGPLTLDDDPDDALHAASKQYVDAAAASKVTAAGGSMSGRLSMVYDNPDIVIGSGAGSWRMGKAALATVAGNWFLQHSTDGFAANFTDAFVATPDGKIGLATNTPVEKLHVAAPAIIATSRVNNDGSLEINSRGTGDRESYVDFHSSGLPSALDYSARLYRGASANGTYDLINTGTGPIRLMPATAVPVQIGVQDASNFLQVLRGGGDEGGEIRLQKPATNATIASDVTIDSNRDTVRFFENGGTLRGVYIDLAGAPAAIAGKVIHTGNFSAQVIAGDTQDVGKYVFAYNNGGAVSFGGTASGANLQPSSSNALQAGTINGTWRAQGHGNAAGNTLWQRIA